MIREIIDNKFFFIAILALLMVIGKALTPLVGVFCVFIYIIMSMDNLRVRLNVLDQKLKFLEKSGPE
jgi:hypothetical protein